MGLVFIARIFGFKFQFKFSFSSFFAVKEFKNCTAKNYSARCSLKNTVESPIESQDSNMAYGLCLPQFWLGKWNYTLFNSFVMYLNTWQ